MKPAVLVICHYIANNHRTGHLTKEGTQLLGQLVKNKIFNSINNDIMESK